MQWLKLYNSLRSYPKLLRLTAEQMWGVVALLILANENAERGRVELDNEDLAPILRCTPEQVQLLLALLEKKGFVERLDGGGIRVVEWDEYQVSDPTAGRRMREYRARKKAEEEAKTVNKTPEKEPEKGTVTRNVTPVTRNDTVTVTPVTRLDIDRDIDTTTSLRSVVVCADAPKAKKGASIEFLKSAADVWQMVSKDPALSHHTQAHVEAERLKCLDWLTAKGKAYKDYPAFFRNWLKSPYNTKPNAPNTHPHSGAFDKGASDAELAKRIQLRNFDQ